MDSEDEKGDEDKGNSFNINRWNAKLPKQTLNKTNILLISFFLSVEVHVQPAPM